MWNTLSLKFNNGNIPSISKIDNTKFGTIKNYIFFIQVKNHCPPSNEKPTQNPIHIIQYLFRKGIWGRKG